MFKRYVVHKGIHLLLLLVASALFGCESGEKTLMEVDPAAVPADPGFQMVVDILDRTCVPCHRGGASGPALLEEDEDEDDPDYDTCRGILEGLDGLVESGIQEESMPPGAWPRLTEAEKLIILRWIQNGACAPCNPCP